MFGWPPQKFFLDPPMDDTGDKKLLKLERGTYNLSPSHCRIQILIATVEAIRLGGKALKALYSLEHSAAAYQGQCHDFLDGQVDTLES